MDLRVRLFAALRERARTSELVLEGLSDDLDVGGLKREIERRHPELGSLAHVAGVVGTEYARDDCRLRAGDEISLLPPVSGGSSRAGEDLARGVFELSAEPLEPARVHARVLDPECGAIATFTGTTRAENRGRRVVRLEYEAFAEMTGPEMARIFAACRASIGSERAPERRVRMLCQHRIGVVGVGEPSVTIGVASPHRDAAFEACRFLIDVLKQTLPIWKKEVYADGEHWIGDRS